MIKLSDYIFDFLKDRGIGCAFMVPGGGAMHLVDSIGKSGIRYVCCQHEQAAAIAAEAMGQHTNKPGLVLVTSGPGSTNAITGVTAGWIDSTPMIILSGQAKRSDLVGNRGVRQIGSQEVQIVDMIRPVTKYAVQVLEPLKIRYYLEKAYYEATNGRPGPVWLDIPLDVQANQVEPETLEGFDPPAAEVGDIREETERTAALLKSAQKPLLLVGNGVKLAGAEEELYEFMRKWQIPVQTTWKAIDMIGEDDPLYIGHPGIMGDRGANLVLQEADVLLSIGSRLDTSITAFNDRNFAKSAKRVIVDIDPNEIARMDMEMEAGIACDAKQFLQSMLKEDPTGKNDYSGWNRHCHKVRAKYPVITDEHKAHEDFVSAYYFIGRLCELLRPEDVIVPESSGGAGEITYQAFQIKYGQKMKNAAGLGSMGFGLPYALGSCLANSGRRTILINGDGAFQLNIQELETVHRLNLPLKIFIWNNNGYASIRIMQMNAFESHFVGSDEASGFTVPDISKIAEAYGIKTCRIRNNRELDKMLPEIMADDKMILCELMVLPFETVSPRVKAIRLENGNMASSPLEKMCPYIE